MRCTYQKNRIQFFCQAYTFHQRGGRVYGKMCRPSDGRSGGVGVSDWSSKENAEREAKEEREETTRSDREIRGKQSKSWPSERPSKFP